MICGGLFATDSSLIKNRPLQNEVGQQLELAASGVLSGVIAVVLIILLVLYALLHFAEL